VQAVQAGSVGPAVRAELEEVLQCRWAVAAVPEGRKPVPAVAVVRAGLGVAARAG